MHPSSKLTTRAAARVRRRSEQDRVNGGGGDYDNGVAPTASLLLHIDRFPSSKRALLTLTHSTNSLYGSTSQNSEKLRNALLAPLLPLLMHLENVLFLSLSLFTCTFLSSDSKRADNVGRSVRRQFDVVVPAIKENSSTSKDNNDDKCVFAE